jgi:hypothetical protein
MKKGRRFVTAVVISSSLALGFSVGGGTTMAYASGSTVTTATFCSELASYIARLQGLPDGRLKDFLLRIANAVHDKHC